MNIIKVENDFYYFDNGTNIHRDKLQEHVDKCGEAVIGLPENIKNPFPNVKPASMINRPNEIIKKEEMRKMERINIDPVKNTIKKKVKKSKVKK